MRSDYTKIRIGPKIRIYPITGHTIIHDLDKFISKSKYIILVSFK